jgi:tetratricopeptide (TPR) repeat protein
VSAGWEERVADLWASFDDVDEATFLARMDALAAELPEAVAEFERASAFDSTGHEQEAVAHYRRALELGLDDTRRRRATIQLASSLRNVGEVDASIALLTVEREQPSDELDDAVAAFLALALLDAGREREAVSVALGALAPHLPRYQRSLAGYAAEIGRE